MSYFVILKEALQAKKAFNSLIEDSGKKASGSEVAAELLKRADGAEAEHVKILDKAKTHKVWNKEIEQLEKNLKKIRDMKNDLKLAGVHTGQEAKLKFPAVRHGLFDKGFKSHHKATQLKAVRETGKGLPDYKQVKRRGLAAVEKKVEKKLSEPTGRLMGGRPGADKVVPVTRSKTLNLKPLAKLADKHIGKLAKESAKDKSLMDPKEPEHLKNLGSGIHRIGTKPI